MPSKPKDLSGLIFGRLTVSKITNIRYNVGSVIWSCDCSCGNKDVKISARNLKSNHTKSCGCLQIESVTTHGASKSKDKQGLDQLDYVLWHGMKTRCYTTTASNYKYYGARGIKVYRKWKNDFEAFAKYIRTLENCPTEKILTSRLFGKRIPRTIDRINNDATMNRVISSGLQEKNKQTIHLQTVKLSLEEKY